MSDEPDVPPSSDSLKRVSAAFTAWHKREGYIFPAYEVLFAILAREIDAAVLAEGERCAKLVEDAIAQHGFVLDAGRVLGAAIRR